MKPMVRATAVLALFALASWATAAVEINRPNIVVILADDLGYGDVKCLGGARSKIPTLNIDRLAAGGMIFTDAHSSSSVCTPTRYGILTGRYNWRSRLQKSVLPPYGQTLIAMDRLTVAALLKQNGYATAAIGKWHLGWNWAKGYDFCRPIGGGPTSAGFDYYFGVDAPNYPPFCFIDNDRTVGIPTVPLPKELLVGNLVNILGPALPRWNLEAILPTITDKACQFIGKQAKVRSPFFLYLPLTSPHTPIVPTKDWQDKSGLNRYADFVMQTDGGVGQVLDALEKSGIAKSTLIIFTSDNGCSRAANIKALEGRGHFPSERRRGYKADIWDGGHRIPLIARWPGTVKAGTQCGQMVCLNDLMATCADLVGAKLPDNAGEDSVSLLPLLKGEDKPVRQTLVHHSIEGKFAIRDGKWKLILCSGSGGWSAGATAPVQLYDMSVDEGECKNLQAEHPDIVKRLTAELEKMVADGRSTPGPKQKNDVPVDIFKRGK